jgi:hypothetical protein
MVVPEHGASARKNRCGATAKTALLASRSISLAICFLMNPVAPCHEIGSFDNAGIRSPLIVTLLEFGRSIRVSLVFVDSSSKQTAENSLTLGSSLREVFGALGCGANNRASATSSKGPVVVGAAVAVAREVEAGTGDEHTKFC